jgi:hypothetical protein
MIATENRVLTDRQRQLASVFAVYPFATWFMYDHSGSRDPSGALLIVASSLVVTELAFGFDQFGFAHGSFRP